MTSPVSTPDEAAQSLIGNSNHQDHDFSRTADGSDEHVSSRVLNNSKATLWLLTFSAGLSGLLFGYDTGVISSTLVSFGSTSLSRAPTDWDKSLITSSTSLCALLASAPSGHFADRFGRKPLIALASLLFVAGALIQCAAHSVPVMILGRAIVGLAVGTASGIVPVYLSEIAPRDLRGRLVTVQSLFITGGQVVAYTVGWAVHGRWRLAVGLGALPAVIQCLLLNVMYESPRWLIMNGQTAAARQILEQLNHGKDSEALVERIQDELAAEGKRKDGSHGRFKDALSSLLFVEGNRRALTIACMLQGLQQLCGFNVLMYFSATIFSLVGFVNPIAPSLSIAGTNFAFTLVAFTLVDSLGRRRTLLYTIPFMIVGLSLCSFCFHNMPALPSSSSVAPPPSVGSMYTTALVSSLMLYVAAYATGLGCVPWQQSELFPLNVRSLGSGLATATNWSANSLVGVTFLPLMASLGPMLTFAIYVLVCAVGWVLVWLIYPETKGLELEDISELLSKGWAVGARRPTRVRQA